MIVSTISPAERDAVKNRPAEYRLRVAGRHGSEKFSAPSYHEAMTVAKTQDKSNTVILLGLWKGREGRD